jgi:Xaa-Pro aminopeptidase
VSTVAIQGQRRDALRDILREKDMAAALISTLVNVRYLTGFTGSNAALLVCADGRDVFATDGRYTDQAATQLPDVERITTRFLLDDLLTLANGRSLPDLALETHRLSADDRDSAASSFNGQTRGLGEAVEGLRVTKDETEIAALRSACRISVEALEQLLEGPFLGRTELEVARDLEWRMYALGAEAIAFDTIVASGPHSAIPHHQPTERRLGPGDLLKIDFGARFAGYHADCTRTMVVHAPPTGWQLEIYDLVAEAQAAGRHALVCGAARSSVDEASRQVIEGAGHGEHFLHAVGHGVGLEIHEDPYLGARSTGKLLDRTPVTVEPGVYLPGRGGVRIEDTLVVGPDAPDLLTTTTRELLVVG